jgi:hypothetical protein
LIDHEPVPFSNEFNDHLEVTRHAGDQTHIPNFFFIHSSPSERLARLLIYRPVNQSIDLEFSGVVTAPNAPNSASRSSDTTDPIARFLYCDFAVGLDGAVTSAG